MILFKKSLFIVEFLVFAIWIQPAISDINTVKANCRNILRFFCYYKDENEDFTSTINANSKCKLFSNFYQTNPSSSNSTFKMFLFNIDKMDVSEVTREYIKYINTVDTLNINDELGKLENQKKYNYRPTTQNSNAGTSQGNKRKRYEAIAIKQDRQFNEANTKLKALNKLNEQLQKEANTKQANTKRILLGILHSLEFRYRTYLSFVNRNADLSQAIQKTTTPLTDFCNTEINKFTNYKQFYDDLVLNPDLGWR